MCAAALSAVSRKDKAVRHAAGAAYTWILPEINLKHAASLAFLAGGDGGNQCV